MNLHVKWSKRRLLCILIIAVAVTGFLVQTYAYPGGYTAGQTITINNAALNKPCSILIGINGTYTFMQDCGTGSILFSSTSAVAVINDAIGNLTSAGGTVFIKTGKYVISSYIQMKTNVTLDGEGSGSILQMASGFPNTPTPQGLIYIHDAENVTVKNLHLDGNYAGNSNTNGTWIVLITGWDSDHVSILNNLLTSSWSYGIYFGYHITGNTDITVSGNTVLNFVSDGIHLAKTTGGIITGNTVAYGSDYGITTSYSNRILVSNNVVHDIDIPNPTPHFATNSWAGLGVQSSASLNSTDQSFIGNQVWNCPGYGFYHPAYGGSNGYGVHLLVEGNSFRNVGYGAYIPQTDFAVVKGNSFDTLTEGVYADSAAYHTTIDGNQFLTVSSYGMDLQGKGLQVTNNQFRRVTSDAIVIKNTNTYNVISGNTFEYLGKTGIYIISGSQFSIMGNNILGNASSTNPIDILIDGTTSYVVVQGNILRGGVMTGIYVASGATYVSIIGNDLSTCVAMIQDYSNASIIMNNLGYNPKGHIANAFYGSTKNIIQDVGSTASPVNATAMTVTESPKLIMVVTGTYTAAYTLVIRIDGTQVISINNPAANLVYSFALNPGQTFYCQYRSAQTTFVVSGM